MLWTLPSSLQSMQVSHPCVCIGHPTLNVLQSWRIYVVLTFKNRDVDYALIADKTRWWPMHTRRLSNRPLILPSVNSQKCFCKEATKEKSWSAFKKVTCPCNPHRIGTLEVDLQRLHDDAQRQRLSCKSFSYPFKLGYR